MECKLYLDKAVKKIKLLNCVVLTEPTFSYLEYSHYLPNPSFSENILSFQITRTFKIHPRPIGY